MKILNRLKSYILPWQKVYRLQKKLEDVTNPYKKRNGLFKNFPSHSYVKACDLQEKVYILREENCGLRHKVQWEKFRFSQVLQGMLPAHTGVLPDNSGEEIAKLDGLINEFLGIVPIDRKAEMEGAKAVLEELREINREKQK